MLTDTLIQLFKRDLTKLKGELNLYDNEAHLWLTPDGINNCAGNLAIHLVGNLNHFIGAVLGNTGYVRQRDREFSDKNIPRDNILKDIDEVISMIELTLSKLTNEQLQEEYGLRVFRDSMTTEFFLVHLVAHLNYHLGQISLIQKLT